MTTVAVDTKPGAPVCPMQIPSYSYQYPSFKKVQLASVKEGLFHPNLPTFRRMDMDTARHKLPHEHCRTTTSSGPEDFRRATTTLFQPPKTNLSSVDVTATGRQIHRLYTRPEELTKTREGWSQFLDKSPERFQIKLPEIPQQKDLHFVGYSVRYLRPDITASWKYSLRQEPMLDQYGQKPMPANVFARYRDTYPQYSRNIASEAWR